MRRIMANVGKAGAARSAAPANLVYINQLLTILWGNVNALGQLLPVSLSCSNSATAVQSAVAKRQACWNSTASFLRETFITKFRHAGECLFIASNSF